VQLLAARGADLEFADTTGLRPIDHAAGRTARAFLEPEAAPQKETIKILRDLIVARTGREPQEFKGQLPSQNRGTAGAGQGLGR
jgi:hypothetical protein